MLIINQDATHHTVVEHGLRIALSPIGEGDTANHLWIEFAEAIDASDAGEDDFEEIGEWWHPIGSCPTALLTNTPDETRIDLLYNLVEIAQILRRDGGYDPDTVGELAFAIPNIVGFDSPNLDPTSPYIGIEV